MSAVQEQVALVTGAAGGVGAGIARSLAANGAKVGLVDLDLLGAQRTADEINAASGNAIALCADVSQSRQVRAAADLVAHRFGGLHILVNCAAQPKDNEALTNGNGTLLTSQIALKHMVSKQYGRIISITSPDTAGRPELSDQFRAKTELQSFTTRLAIELGPYGVCVNSIIAGDIEPGVTSLAGQPRNTAITGIVNAALFFAGQESSYVTGQVLRLGGSPDVPYFPGGKPSRWPPPRVELSRLIGDSPRVPCSSPLSSGQPRPRSSLAEAPISQRR